MSGGLGLLESRDMPQTPHKMPASRASHQNKHASHVYSPLDQRGTCMIPRLDAPAFHCNLVTRRDL